MLDVAAVKRQLARLRKCKLATLKLLHHEQLIIPQICSTVCPCAMALTLWYQGIFRQRDICIEGCMLQAGRGCFLTLRTITASMIRMDLPSMQTCM